MKISIPAWEIDTLVEKLMDVGIRGFEIQDPYELEEFLETSVYYDYVEDQVLEQKEQPATVTIYLPTNSQGADQLGQAKAVIAALAQEDIFAEYTLENVNEEDWVNNWKQYFKPLPIGSSILIKPSWEEIPKGMDAGRKVLEIDPSSSFGTGTHETTQLCIEQLEKAVFPGAKVLDMGCGSGILGVAAMLLGAGSVRGVDIEEDSIRVARENAVRNGIADEDFILHQGNILMDEALREVVGGEKYDIIVANIVADVIIAMSPLFKEFLKEDGVLITSGIITERIGDVQQAIEVAGFTVSRTAEKKEWAAICAGDRV
ncbi:MAG: 50S ribosomal protein L11 methyltransferase [Christensenellaceae bacterium]|nr:50S ribosomal protein L11 methyltransferase [Christensenellaceae bacterium]